jgi:hypothetical protein
MAKIDKLIEVKLTHDELCEILNGLTVKALGSGLDKETKALGRKLSEALKKLEKNSG